MDERLTAVHSARLSEGSAWSDVTLGVSDRRLLWVEDDGQFVTLGFDAISTVRSRPRTTPTYRGIEAPWLLGGGVVAALVCLLGLVVVTARPLEPLLLLVAVAGLAAAASLRRVDDVTEWPPAATVTALVRKYDVEGRFRLDERHHTDVDEPRRVLVGVSLLAAGGSLLALLALAASPLATLFAFGAVGGLAIADYARRRGDDADPVELDWRREQEVSISTTDGRTVRVRTDPSSTLGRELSRVAFVEPADRVSIAPAQS